MTQLDRSLPELASQINQKYRLAEDTARTSIGYARECGELLSQAKGLVGHGEWIAWLETNFPGTARTAQKWMRIAEHWNAITAKNELSSFLGINEAVESIGKSRALPAPANLNPYRLFEEFTFVNDGPDVEWLKAKLRPSVEKGFLPIIEWDETDSVWVFHSLMTPDGNTSKKPDALLFLARENGLPYRDIGDIATALAKLRRDMGCAKWKAHCDENWGATEWVDETIDTINFAMSRLAA